MAFLSVDVAALPRRQDTWGGPLGFQACRRRWLREPVWPEQETHLRLGAAQPETLATRLHRRATVFAPVFLFSIPVTSASYLPPRFFPRQAIVLIMKLPSRKWCVMPPVNGGARQGNYLRDCSSHIPVLADASAS